MIEEKPIDPGNEPSKAKPHSLPWLLSLIRKNNGIDLKAGEVMLLVDEIDRLAGKLVLEQNANKTLTERIKHAQLRLDSGNDCFDSLEDVVDSIVRARNAQNPEKKG